MVGSLDRDDDPGTIRILTLVNPVRLRVETNDNRSVVRAVEIGVPVMAGADAHVGQRRVMVGLTEGEMGTFY